MMSKMNELEHLDSLDELTNSSFYNYFTFSMFSDYVDIDWLRWLIWLFTPVMITFLFPIVIIAMLYINALIIYVYKKRNLFGFIRETVQTGDYWHTARQIIALFWDSQGWIYHGYEVEGMENIPDEGPALFVYYHGALPVDYYYLLSKVYLVKKRLIRAVGDKFLFSIPGWKLMMSVVKVFPGSLQTCTQVLEQGELLSIAPGGVREAQFGTNSYQLIWEKRIGFARVACNAKCKIIPVFTVNLREAFRSVSLFQSWFRAFYDRTRLPIVPIYGGFPVKLRTIIGKPIEYDPTLSPEQVTANTAKAIEDLICEHQRLPGNIFMAVLDRFVSTKKKTNLSTTGDSSKPTTPNGYKQE